MKRGTVKKNDEEKEKERGEGKKEDKIEHKIIRLMDSL